MSGTHSDSAVEPPLDPTPEQVPPQPASGQVCAPIPAAAEAQGPWRERANLPRLLTVFSFAAYLAASWMPWGYMGYGTVGVGRGYAEEVVITGWEGEVLLGTQVNLNFDNSFHTYTVSLAVLAAAGVSWLRLDRGIPIPWLCQLFVNCGVATFGILVLAHLARTAHPMRPIPFGVWLGIAALSGIIASAVVDRFPGGRRGGGGGFPVQVPPTENRRGAGP